MVRVMTVTVRDLLGAAHPALRVTSRKHRHFVSAARARNRSEAGPKYLTLKEMKQQWKRGIQFLARTSSI